ncbi:MAG: hypothetical protein U0271_28615 [Polyangiaceae bacterium]
MKSLKSKFVLAIAVGGLVATTGTDAVAGKAANDSLVDKLPKSGSLKIPKSITNPKSIPATEHVDGFYVETPGPSYGEGPTYAMVYASKDAATAHNNGTPATEAESCFMTAYPNPGGDVNWSNSLATTTSVQNYKHASYGPVEYGSVQLVRADRVEKVEGDRLTYSVKVAFVDAETQGVRLQSTQSVEFIKLRDLPGNVSVWGSQSDGEVTFLVQRKKHPKERFFFGPLMVSSAGGMNNVSSQEACPVVFSLKTGKGVATNAVVTLDAVLDVVGTGEDQGPGFVESSIAMRPDTEGAGQLEAKVRTMRIGFSSTWMTQDTAPVISVSNGWSGRERTQQI